MPYNLYKHRRVFNFTTQNESRNERDSEYKYLCIRLDEKFKYKYISKLVRKLRHKLGLLYRNKMFFPLHSRNDAIINEW